MTPRYFGTDGVRAEFGTPPLDESRVRRLGLSLAGLLPGTSPLVILGGDTRDSSPVLARWMAAGLRAGGAEVRFLGTVPTPVVAHAVRSTGAAGGVVLSASHNPWPDNGIKLVDERGYKWDPAREAALEEVWDATESDPDGPQDLEVEDHETHLWRASLVESLGGAGALRGLRIAVDAGNGAASPWIGDILEELGATSVIVHDRPNGRNINEGCGSTSPEVVADLVRSEDADLGFSFDGDADRVVLVDRDGTERDGDAVLLVWARDLDSRGELPGRAVVATSMSNLGLEVALRREGIDLVRCGVGDREVVTTLRERGLDLGGEQSGHIVRLALSTTGDGILTALQVAGIVQRTGRGLHELLADFRRFPQLIRNVRVTSKPDLESLPAVRRARASVLEDLGDEGRLVLRYSGTERLARVMLEGPDEARIRELAGVLADAIHSEIGAP